MLQALLIWPFLWLHFLAMTLVLKHGARINTQSEEGSPMQLSLIYCYCNKLNLMESAS